MRIQSRHARLVLGICLTGGLAFAVGCAAVLDELERATAGAGAASSTPADGLREALRIGTARAVDALSAENGYLGNPALRIPLPAKLESVGRALRTVGLGAVIDDFDLSMNRAAEQAVPLAKPVFVEAIRQMSFQDAMAILRGQKHEATDYFREKTSAQLAELFRPPVEQKLGEVGATRTFNDLMGRAKALPFVEVPSFDLAGYVTDEALAGLFEVLGEEEQRIRDDPAARTTELLRRWFGTES